jgi:predicted TIM-barrel fold metal-dependent hydrolase
VTNDGLRAADSDMHVMEPPDLWQRYIDPAYRHAAPVGLMEIPRDMRVKVKSHVLLRLGPVRPMASGKGPWSSEQEAIHADAERSGWDAKSQLHAMDREGLDRAVLFPSRGLFVLGLDAPEMIGSDGLEPEFAAAIARAYNDWMFDFCKADPKRLLGAAMVPPHNVPAAVAEARRAVEQLGFRAVFLAPGSVKRRPWHHPDYDPLWAECERLGIPATFHGGGQTHLRPDFSLEVLDKLMMWHTFNQPLAMQTVAVSLCAGGVFARFPKLRVGLLEGNCGWAPWLMHRLDEHYEWVGHMEVPELKQKPSEYFRANCFLATEADEPTVADYVRWFGDDNLVFSTDYPHADSKYPRAVQEFGKLPLSPASQKKILWDNWCRLYGEAV